jgi:hypothetical protein
MSGFSAAWLALREPYDLAARNRIVRDAATAAFSRRPSVCLVDLACGTGATLRALADGLPSRQTWRLVDNDLGLLARAASLPVPPDTNVVARPLDLVRDLELALEAPVDLVTISALLDLVSVEWLDRLVMEIAARGLPLYAALTCNGRTLCEPREELDADILAAFNAHLRADKGFGPALGPSAGSRAAERFACFGYTIVEGPSDWILGPSDCDIQETLLASWAEVAQAGGGLSQSGVREWLQRRRLHVAQGRSRIRVGHSDFFARPITTR